MCTESGHSRIVSNASTISRSTTAPRPAPIRAATWLIAALASLLAVFPLADAQAQFSVSATFAQRIGTPAAAYDAENDRWLVVWSQPASSTRNRIMGRFVTPGGGAIGDQFAISSQVLETGDARVAFDPYTGEFLVVWVGEDPIENLPRQVFARRVTGAGEVLAPERSISAGGIEETNPDVGAGVSRQNSFPPEIDAYFLVTWEDKRSGERRIWAANVRGGSGGAVIPSGSAFLVDAGSRLPPSHESARPRISPTSPVLVEQGSPYTVDKTLHQVVFEVQVPGAKRDVYLAGILPGAVRSVVRVTDSGSTGENAWQPQVDFGPRIDRNLIVYRQSESAGAQLTGQLVESTDTSPYYQLVGEPFSVRSSASEEGTAVAAYPFDDTFHAAAASTDLHVRRVAGHNVYRSLDVDDDPPPGAIDAPALSHDSGGDCLLIVYRHLTLESQANQIRGRLLCNLSRLSQTLPVADAGSDFTVPESTRFKLIGLDSDDPDGDPIRYQWTQTSGSEARLVEPSTLSEATPELTAPTLTGVLSEVLEFELAVDDFRSRPAFFPVDTVKVTVRSTGDENPPVARAGTDQTVVEGQRVVLDGCESADPDPGEAIQFSWRLDGLVPPDAVLTPPLDIIEPESCNPTFIAPNVSRDGGAGADLLLELTVTSTTGGVSQDTVTIHVDPVAEDSLEPDDGPAFAKVFQLNDLVGVRHTFNSVAPGQPPDEDWLVFAALEGTRYQIEARRLDPGVDVVMQIYAGDGVTPIGPPINIGGPGENEFIFFSPEVTGTFYIQFISIGAPGGYTPILLNASFEGELPGFGEGRTIDALGAMPPIGCPSVVVSQGGLPVDIVLGQANGTWTIIQEAGSYDLTMSRAGYTDATGVSITIQANMLMNIGDTAMMPDAALTDSDNDGASNALEEVMGTSLSTPDVLFDLQAGTNLISLPIDPSLVAYIDGVPGTTLDAAALAEALEAESLSGLVGGMVVSTVRQMDGTYVGTFSIAAETGYEVQMAQARSKLLSTDPCFLGLAPGAMSIDSGVSWVGFAGVSDGVTAYQLLQSPGLAGNAVSISRVDPSSGRIETAVMDSGVPSGVDFDVVRGEGYILGLDTSVVGYSPP